MRPLAFALVALSACAGPPGVRLCDDPPGTLIEPEYARIGSGDILSASIRYTGCGDVDDVVFRVCAPDEAWIDRNEVRVELWHAVPDEVCGAEQLADVEASLRGVREAYEDTFDTEEATFTLFVGELPVEYSIEPIEPE